MNVDAIHSARARGAAVVERAARAHIPSITRKTMLTKPRAKHRTRKHLGSLIRSLAWEWVKVHDPMIAVRIKAIAYEECGLPPPKPNTADPYLLELLHKVDRKDAAR